MYQNIFGILITFVNSEDNEKVDSYQTIVEKVKEHKIINIVMKELEIKDELYDIELIIT